MNKNYVVEGKYKGIKINYGSTRVWVETNPYSHNINRMYISSYTVIDETNKEEYSFWKGALGVALFGSAGAITGVKGKKTTEYLVSIEWKEGGKSLICIDGDCYKVLVKSMF